MKHTFFFPFFLFMTAAFLTAVSAKEETIPDLWNGTQDQAVPLYVRTPENAAAPVPALVICPGGGYGGLCIEPEGYGIASWLNEHGVAGFVLEYRLPKGRKNVPLADAQRAIRWVRAHADEYGVDPNRIGIIGFSAGGHLASSAAVHFDSGNPNSSDPLGQVSCRPDFAVLIYPVVTMDASLTHAGSRENLLGPNPTDDEISYFSSEKQIGLAVPPVFLAHAEDDTVVPPANSANFAARMAELGRPCVYVKLPNGGHGLNGYRGDSWDKWQAESLEWLKSL